MKFKKISAILGGFLMVGMTAGIAAAASYPAPFVDNGVADVAIVYGTGAGVSSLDLNSARNIQSSLGSSVEGETTVTGGESFKLYKDSDKIYFGDEMNEVFTDLDDGDITALADGDYDDGEIDVEYEQEVTLGDIAMSLITDSDLNEEEPTIGYYFDDDKVLTYKLSFDDTVAYTDMIDTNLPLFGGEHYVLDADTTSITLLNNADKTTINDGETLTVGDNTVSIIWVDDITVSLKINNYETEDLEKYEYEELDDGSYVVINNIRYDTKESGISQVEFSIGDGKVVLENEEEVEVDDESIDGLTVAFKTNGSEGYIDDISIIWTTNDEVFLTKGDSISMPVFESYGLIFNGLSFGDSEDIVLENGETLVLNMGNYDMDVMYNGTDGTYIGGKEAKLVSINGTPAASQEFAIGDGQRFLATLLDDDLNDVETAYYEVGSLSNNTDNSFDLTLDNQIDTTDKITFDDRDSGEEDDLTDSIGIKVVGVFEEDDDVANTTYYNTTISEDYVNHTTLKVLQDFAVLNVSADSDLQWDTVVSKDGMAIELPSTAASGEYIHFYEANEDNDVETTIGSSGDFVLVTAYDTDDDIYAKVASSSESMMVDETADDKTVGYDAGIHATKVMEDSDAHTLEIEYYADEVPGDLQFITGGTVTSTEGALGDVLLMDTEVATATANNLIIVGGSCINSAAATVLGGHYCGAAFTEATGVGEGQFLIKGFENVLGNKFAVVVAGYEAADTVLASSYLTMKKPDTSESWISTSATEMIQITEAA